MTAVGKGKQLTQISFEKTVGNHILPLINVIANGRAEKGLFHVFSVNRATLLIISLTTFLYPEKYSD